MIRMLVPFTSAELGGSQLMTLRFLHALDRQVFDIDVWLFEEGPYRERLEAAGITVHTLPRSLVRYPWNFHKLHRRIADGHFDVIYLHATRLIAQIARDLDIPCVERVNMPRDKESGGWCQFPLIDRICTGWNTRVIADSVFIKNQLVERGVAAEKISVLYNWADPAECRCPEKRAEGRAELRITDDKVMVLSVGRLAPEKGHEDIIDAASVLRSEIPSLRFIIAGTGPEEKSLKRKIHEKGLNDRVRLIGFRNDVGALYAAADILLHPSRREAFSTTVLEGMTAGLAIVATSVGGTPEQIRDGETGLLIPSGNIRAVVEALRRLASDKELRAHLGQNAKRFAEEHFRPEPSVEAFTQLIKEAIEERKAKKFGVQALACSG